MIFAKIIPRFIITANAAHELYVAKYFNISIFQYLKNNGVHYFLLFKLMFQKEEFQLAMQIMIYLG